MRLSKPSTITITTDDRCGYKGGGGGGGYKGGGGGGGYKGGGGGSSKGGGGW